MFNIDLFYIIGGVGCFVCIVTSCHFIKDITSGLSAEMLLLLQKKSFIAWVSFTVVVRHVPRLILATHSSNER